MFPESDSMEEEDIASDCDDNVSPRNWDDHNIKVYEQKSYKSSTDAEGIPVQCTEDLPEKKHLDPESEQVDNPDIVEIDESIDLPLNAVKNQDSGSENRINVSKLYANTEDQLTDDSTLAKNNELQVQLKPKPESETDRKLTSADEEGNVDSSELRVMRYLRPLSRQRTRQGIQVYMLHVQRYPASVAEKQPEKDPTFTEDYSTEMNRLKTYVKFPGSFPVFVIKLAKDGFVYCQKYDSVECYFCRLRLSLEELRQPGLNLDQLHREKAPYCPFKRGEDCGNEPVPTGEQFKHFFKEPSSSNMSTVDKFSASRSTGVTSSTEVTSRNERESSVANNVPQQGGSPAEVYQPDAVTLPQSASVQQPAAVNRETVVTDSVRTVGQPVRRDAVVTDSVPTVAQPASSASASGAANSKSKPNSKRNKNRSSGAATSASENTRTTNSNAPRSSNSSRKAASSNTNSTASKTSTQDTSTNTNSNSTSEGNGEAPQKLTYADLGIFSEKPKRADMVVMQKRLSSFTGKWKETHKQTPEMLAAAGMYYAGKCNNLSLLVLSIEPSGKPSTLLNFWNFQVQMYIYVLAI